MAAREKWASVYSTGSRTTRLETTSPPMTAAHVSFARRIVHPATYGQSVQGATTFLAVSIAPVSELESHVAVTRNPPLAIACAKTYECVRRMSHDMQASCTHAMLALLRAASGSVRVETLMSDAAASAEALPHGVVIVA